MIRERVAQHGLCRPLEPESELAAMTMPNDEIGVIKEGPAMRYLKGQALWDKKFSHALKSVAKHRKRNLEDARKKDAGKIVQMWQERVRNQHAESEIGGNTTDWETDRDIGGGDNHILDKSWSWSWALKGEAPPPSAIVSRRDFVRHRLRSMSILTLYTQGEARELALMADRMDAAHASPVNGLSLWVGLAAFFSHSSERNRAHEALTKAKADLKGRRKEEESDKGTEGGDYKRKGKRRAGGVVQRMSTALGLNKQPSGDTDGAREAE